MQFVSKYSSGFSTLSPTAFFGREVNNSVYCVLVKHTGQKGFVQNIAFVEGHRSIGDLGEAVDHVVPSVGKVVDDDNVMACGFQFHISVRSDISGAPGQQDLGHAQKPL